MWSEKYRPRRLEDLIDQSNIVDGLRNLLKAPAAIPHLLFSGPPGTGKTTMALIVSRTILGPYVDDYALILNASDERKLEVVREKIKTFARYFDRRAGVPFRLVILDEADEMTRDAQTALRRIMEDHSSYTRFILTCNYSSDIIEPIQSRCTLFRFTRLAGNDIADFLEKICKNEKVKFTQEGLNLILHGHTHRYRDEFINGIKIFNPGECAGSLKGKNAVGLVNTKNLKTERIFF